MCARCRVRTVLGMTAGVLHARLMQRHTPLAYGKLGIPQISSTSLRYRSLGICIVLVLAIFTLYHVLSPKARHSKYAVVAYVNKQSK